MTLTPNQKKTLSALLVGVASALLVGASKVLVPQLPAYAQALAVSGIAAVAHYVDALGHTDRVEAAIKEQAGK